MGWGFFTVGVLSLAVFVGVQVWANGEDDAYHEERSTVARKNLDIAVENFALPTALEHDRLADPGKPLSVRHPNLVAIGAALVVAVIGTIIVLLAGIAADQRHE
jgi:hypothetical protein